MTNPNYIPPYYKRYLTLDAPPLGRFCRLIRLPDDPHWIGTFDGLFSSLADPDQWRQFGTLTQEEMAQAWLEIFLDQEDTNTCALVPAPYWDTETSADDQEPADEQTWYGYVIDALAPIDELTFVENVAVWGITGFVAYSAGPAAALTFRTVARNFVLAVQATDVPSLVRIVVDLYETYVDTSGYAEGDIIEVPIVADPDIETHDIMIIDAGTP